MARHPSLWASGASRDVPVHVAVASPDTGSGPGDGGDGGTPGEPGGPSPGRDAGSSVESAEILELRMLLQVALARLGGPLDTDETRPRKIQDLDVLEEKLTAALGQIRTLRQRFGSGA